MEDTIFVMLCSVKILLEKKLGTAKKTFFNKGLTFSDN